MRVVSSIAVVVATSGLAALSSCREPDHGRDPPPPPVISSLSATKTGDGRGIVRTLPAGLVCDVDCDSATFDYEDVEAITVVAELGRNANFKSLSCQRKGSDEVPLTVTILDDNGQATLDLPTIEEGDGVDWDCEANFILVHTLQIIANQGAGTGRVTGTLSKVIGQDEPKRVDCASTDTCTSAYFDGEEEVITATADVGSVFIDWDFCGEADPTNPVQTLLMTADENCRPRFDLAP